MKTEQIIILVVAFFLGMLLLNMVKNVCGCELKEGFERTAVVDGLNFDDMKSQYFDEGDVGDCLELLAGEPGDPNCPDIDTYKDLCSADANTICKASRTDAPKIGKYFEDYTRNCANIDFFNTVKNSGMCPDAHQSECADGYVQSLLDVFCSQQGLAAGAVVSPDADSGLANAIDGGCIVPQGGLVCPGGGATNCVGQWSEGVCYGVQCDDRDPGAQDQGTKHRQYSITTPATGGGTPCEAADGAAKIEVCTTPCTRPPPTPPPPTPPPPVSDVICTQGGGECQNGATCEAEGTINSQCFCEDGYTMGTYCQSHFRDSQSAVDGWVPYRMDSTVAADILFWAVTGLNQPPSADLPGAARTAAAGNKIGYIPDGETECIPLTPMTSLETLEAAEVWCERPNVCPH